ncbi:MAG: GNAT family protein [Chloroflexota bacterium]
MTPLLTTERLRLRGFCPDDIAPFAAYRSDPAVAKYQGWETPYSHEQAKEFVALMRKRTLGTAGQWYQIAIEHKADGQLLGDVAVHTLAEDGKQAEIGFTLAREHQGQGVAREAVTAVFTHLFTQLEFHRLIAICDVENLPSQRLLERLGMRREAHYVENYWFKGAWHSEYLYAILHSEWETAYV